MGNSFEVVALPFNRALYGRAFRLIGNKEDAEDLVQITYMKAWQFWDKFDGTNCGAWLNTILKNSFINMYRLKKNSFDLGIMLWKESDTVCVNIRNPEQEFVSKMVTERIGEIIGEMPYNLRQITFLRIVEDYSYTQIMSIMGLTLGTVKGRLFKSRKLLQEGLECLNES